MDYDEEIRRRGNALVLIPAYTSYSKDLPCRLEASDNVYCSMEGKELREAFESAGFEDKATVKFVVHDTLGNTYAKRVTILLNTLG